MRFDFQKKRATQPRAAKQTGHTSYTHTGARGGGLQDYIHTQVPEVPECTFSLNPAPPSRLGRLSAKVGVT
jgi:hypothetical protein